MKILLGLLVAFVLAPATFVLGVYWASLDCVDACKCSGRGSEGCTCITAAALQCPCRDCPCDAVYHSKAALEDIKALKKKIESHCCEKE